MVHEQMTDPDSGATPLQASAALERLAGEMLREQRRARRWGIFFKLFFATYLVALLVLLQTDGAGPGSGAHTALVELQGVIGPGQDTDADTVVGGLRAAFAQRGVKGVILRANSPGGSPVQSAYINDEIVRLRSKYPDTPLYVVISDVCASGCYYAAAAADRIYASRGSIVGSIGVLMDNFGFVDAIGKLGIERRLMTAGKNKGLLDPFSPLNPEDAAHMQGLLDRVHRQFIQVVKAGRGNRLADDEEIFSGLFWTGEEAKKLGLVDGFGSAGYVAREIIQAEEIVDYTPGQDLLERFADRIGAAIARGFGDPFGTGIELR